MDWKSSYRRQTMRGQRVDARPPLKTATSYVISAWWRSKLGKVCGFQIRMERTVDAGDIKRDMQLPSYI